MFNAQIVPYSHPGRDLVLWPLGWGLRPGKLAPPPQAVLRVDCKYPSRNTGAAVVQPSDTAKGRTGQKEQKHREGVDAKYVAVTAAAPRCVTELCRCESTGLAGP